MPYYREPNGDYLYVWPRAWRPGLHEGRATAIAGLPTSVQTTSVSVLFLKECPRIARRDVPQEWLTAIGE